MQEQESVSRSMLAGLPEEGLSDFLSACQSRWHDAGESIVQAGEPGDELFLILSGKVRVWSGEGAAVRGRTLTILGPGEHFGEAAVISGSPRNATVTALTYVEVLALSAADYKRLVQLHPQLLQNLSRSLTDRLSSMNQSPQGVKHEQREIHSIGILVDDDAGLELARALIEELARDHQQLAVLLTQSQPLPLGQSWDAFAPAEVAVSELRFRIAEATQKSAVITVAVGRDAMQEAAKQCHRIIVTLDSSADLPEMVQRLIDEGPVRQQKVLAWMMKNETASGDAIGEESIIGHARRAPTPELEHAAAVRCRYQRPGNRICFEADSIVRLKRTLYGRRIGLALGGGGARGIAHIGVLQVLLGNGLVFDSIAGTSAGAIVAAAIAAGYSPDEVHGFFRQDMVPPRWVSKYTMLRAIWLLHQFRGGRFENKLRRYLRRLTFAQADFPLSITTLDLVTGQQQIRREGDLVEAVLQSINHPVFGAPVIKDGQMLVDGGVLMNVPASVLRGEGCDRVISVDVGSSLDEQFGIQANGRVGKPGYLGTLLRTMDISRRHCSALHREESDLIIVPETSQFKIEDFHAVDELVEAGRRAGEAALVAARDAIRFEPVLQMNV
ncbi:NTE family protein RssA [Stieleria bergensis]|uniref:NTE family protein RssA n=1 Tax=Stieleria bergensis TaxID=2528025 RepID=A0A517SSW9_9BACT|nr:NTE family protein RssA [Planctomycetes bacterium SV_7m_r]